MNKGVKEVIKFIRELQLFIIIMFVLLAGFILSLVRKEFIDFPWSFILGAFIVIGILLAWPGSVDHD